MSMYPTIILILLLPIKEFIWDFSMDYDYRKISNSRRCINIFERKIPSAPPTIQCIYDLWVHYFDIAMENISIGLAQ